jgi:hypothetical protein
MRLLTLSRKLASGPRKNILDRHRRRYVKGFVENLTQFPGMVTLNAEPPQTSFYFMLWQ